MWWRRSWLSLNGTMGIQGKKGALSYATQLLSTSQPIPAPRSRPEDLDELRELAGRPVAVITKLEKPSAVEQLEEIVARSDAVMVARGDLGGEVAPPKGPTIQRQVLRACRRAGKPVIVATQMLESM